MREAIDDARIPTGVMQVEMQCPPRTRRKGLINEYTHAA